jgi:hypothetical protein
MKEGEFPLIFRWHILHIRTYKLIGMTNLGNYISNISQRSTPKFPC